MCLCVCSKRCIQPNRFRYPQIEFGHFAHYFAFLHLLLPSKSFSKKPSNNHSRSCNSTAHSYEVNRHNIYTFLDQQVPFILKKRISRKWVLYRPVTDLQKTHTNYFVSLKYHLITNIVSGEHKCTHFV